MDEGFYFIPAIKSTIIYFCSILIIRKEMFLIKKIVVDCERNDSVDIRCGGPITLGFDFFVNDNEIDTAIAHIKKELKKYHRPLMGITTADAPDNAKHWSLGEISVCIQQGY